MEAMDPEEKRHVVIIGGGIIGCTTAYFLTRHPRYNRELHRITLLEATAVAAGASGKAGGLLALWAYPACLVPLSYRLHRELAEEHGGAERWGYRRLGCGSIEAVVPVEVLRAQEDARKRQQQQQQQQQQGGGRGSNGGEEEGKEEKEDVKAGAPASLPIASAVAAATAGDDQKPPTQARNPLSPPPPAAGAENDSWAKLPKQDEAASNLLRDSPLPADLDWIDGRLVQQYAEMGQPGATETAQVHPFQFTTAMAELAAQAGVDVRVGAKVTRISLDHGKTAVRSVEYEDRNTNNNSNIQTVDDVTDVVVAAGPWTGRVLPRSRIEGVRAHSVVFRADVSPYAVFTDIRLPTDWAPPHRAARGQRRKHRGAVDPEIYARPGGEVYACGETDSAVALPETADLVVRDDAQCDDLVAYIGTVSPALAAAPVVARQACYLPRHVRFGEERGPLVGATGVPGLWVASGHTCWGIQNGPATGCLMAEMLFEGAARSADIEKLDPRRFKV